MTNISWDIYKSLLLHIIAPIIYYLIFNIFNLDKEEKTPTQVKVWGQLRWLAHRCAQAQFTLHRGQISDSAHENW